jgi:histidyl-tRNA synthetase
MDYKIEGATYKGTRILIKETAKKKRVMLNTFSDFLETNGFSEVMLPDIELASIYTDKAGPEILGQMFTWKDRSDREICLRPEGTATCQLLANTLFKFEKDVKIFYTAECFRYEKPQAGRYRQFTQFGVEWLNPRDPFKASEICKQYALAMIEKITKDYEYNPLAKRGLAYYTEEGFEISIPTLGAQKQVCGGGSYKEGVGFAFGIDRLILV